MKFRLLLIFLFFFLAARSSSSAQNDLYDPGMTDEATVFTDSIRIDGRMYQIAPDFSIPANIDIDSPVKLIFSEESHELLSIDRLSDDASNDDELEYHFGVVNAISKPAIDLTYRVYVDGTGYLFTKDTRIDEKDAFLDKYASVALVTESGRVISCRVIASNTAVPEEQVFFGKVEKIRKNDNDAEITVNGIAHVLTDKTDSAGNVLVPDTWVFGYETGDAVRFISVISDEFPDPDDITAFSGIVNFVSKIRGDGAFYIKTDDTTMRITPDSAAFPDITVGDYVSGYLLNGDVLLISKHEVPLNQSGPDPFLYAGIISRIAINAFQIDDVIIDYDDITKINGRFEEGKYALVSRLDDYAEMIYIVPDSYSDYTYHAVSGVITGIGAENSEGRRAIRLDEDIYYLTEDSVSGKNITYDEIGTALYRGMHQISIIDVLKKPVDIGIRFEGRITAAKTDDPGSSAMIMVGDKTYAVPLTAGLVGFPDLSRLNPGARVEGYALISMVTPDLKSMVK